jgi:hypothetical protein
MAFEWFRSWHGAPTDSKFRVIAKRAGVTPGVVSAVYWALLDYASQNEPRGSVEGFDTETYAEWAGWEESDVLAILDAFTSKQVIIDGRIVAWEKRQPKKEDDSTERVRAFRERQRIAELQALQALQDADATQGNDMKHDVTPGNYRLDKSTDKIDDDDSDQALQALQVLGLFNKPMLDQFNDMWPELSGRRDWIGKAITIARDQGAHSPAYALKVLANSLHTGKEPGYVNGKADPTKRAGVAPLKSATEQAEADARQLEYEAQIAAQLARMTTQ